MDAWAAALIGVGGTLAGGALSYVTEHARWKREQGSRWTDERRALYAQVIVECEYVVHDALGNLIDKELITFGDLDRELRPVRDRLRPLIADLELIGTEDDAAAASDLMASAERLLGKAVKNPDAPAMPAWREWEEALADFRRRARAGLHLSPRSVSLPVSLGRRLVAARVVRHGRPPA